MKSDNFSSMLFYVCSLKLNVLRCSHVCSKRRFTARFELTSADRSRAQVKWNGIPDQWNGCMETPPTELSVCICETEAYARFRNPHLFQGPGGSSPAAKHILVHFEVKQVRKALWTRKGVRATVVV